MNEVYPSLYLNIGKSYETLQDVNEAGRYYQLAANESANLPPGKYSDMIRMGIAKASFSATGTTRDFQRPGFRRVDR